MSKTIIAPATPKTEKPEIEDLSPEIIESLKKTTPYKNIRCRHLYGNKYRVNFMVPDLGPGDIMNITTFRISDSKFLAVKKTADGLVIEDKTIKAAQADTLKEALGR